ncbi:RNB3L protein, partial [Upupa epops]|nr:RNB3L protein [Upupa epops]
EKSVLAQPVFVFEKDCLLKRPAENPFCKAENDFTNCSRKRARSSSSTSNKSDSLSNTDVTLAQKRGRFSSITVPPTFPSSQTVFINIFCLYILQGSSSKSQLRNIIRPAILQPPQALTCPEDPVVSVVTKKETYIQLSEDSSYTSAKNSLSSKIAARLSTTMNFSKTKETHLFENRPVQNSSNSDFVFGENMVERVLEVGGLGIPILSILEKCSNTNPHQYVLFFSFSDMVKTLLRNATLNELSTACISKPVEKIPLDKFEVTTGEEAEHNVLQVNCKLFVFNKLSLTWTERGRGSLRLNDTSSSKHGMLQSRLIMRNQGSLRLILNTRLWDQMVIKRVNRKSLCFPATDQEDHSIQVFLIQASSKDAGYLYAAIHHRLAALRTFAEPKSDVNQIDTKSEIAFQPLNCDSDDEGDEKITQVSRSGS